MSYQDVKDYFIAEEVLLEMIEDSHPDNKGHRGTWTFLKDMLQLGYAWRSHINLTLIHSNGRSDVVNSEEDEEYQRRVMKFPALLVALVGAINICSYLMMCMNVVVAMQSVNHLWKDS